MIDIIDNDIEIIENALLNLKICIDNNKSQYINRDGIRVPRVTEVISRMLHSNSLMYWANRLGLKGLKYREELNKAAALGTRAHSAIEKYLKEKISTDCNIPFLGFLMWFNIISEASTSPVEVIYVEHKIVHKLYGGTLDCLMKINGRIFLIDFKTSNHVTYNYFIQLAAYKYALKTVENIDIDGVIVLQLNKEEPGFKEYLLDFYYIDHKVFMDTCVDAFLSILYAYYKVWVVEYQYNADLFKIKGDDEDD